MTAPRVTQYSARSLLWRCLRVPWRPIVRNVSRIARVVVKRGDRSQGDLVVCQVRDLDVSTSYLALRKPAGFF